MEAMAAEVRLRVWTQSRANGARPPPLQSHFVPVQHLWWHLSPFLPDRVLAVLTHREAQVVATRQGFQFQRHTDGLYRVAVAQVWPKQRQTVSQAVCQKPNEKNSEYVPCSKYAVVALHVRHTLWNPFVRCVAPALVRFFCRSRFCAARAVQHSEASGGHVLSPISLVTCVCQFETPGVCQSVLQSFEVMHTHLGGMRTPVAPTLLKDKRWQNEGGIPTNYFSCACAWERD